MSDLYDDPTMFLFTPENANDPHSAYQRMREECPVARGKGYDGVPEVTISRYDDVCQALRHPEVFSSAPDAVSIGQEHALIPLQVDPPDHSRYRRLLDPQFGPKRMAELESGVREYVNRLIDAFASRGECDFHEEFATPLPSTVFLLLLGLPVSDLPLLLQWRDNTVRPDVDPNDWDAAVAIREQTGRDVNAYFERAIAERREHPDDGLLSRLVHAEMEGRLLTQEELLGMCHLLMLAGLDTVTATLDCFVAYLAKHPEQRRRLVEDPTGASGAVEELIRWETPVQMVARVLKEDTVLDGVELKKGDRAAIIIGAANTDADGFDDPDSVDFARQGNRHVAFGAGPHRCLGSHLARLELRVALEEFHRRIPDYAVAPGAELKYSPGIRQTESLPLVFEPETAASEPEVVAGRA